MDTVNLTLFFFMGLGLGMAHAFDPDHLAAVGAVSAADQQQRVSYSDYALRWSLGHASALGIVAVLVFIFGAAIPDGMSAIAEASVAFLLISLGALALWRTFTKPNPDAKFSKKSAGVVGLVHGTAGSAPLLALIPMGMAVTPLVGLVYVIFFSAGVALSMFALGSGLTFALRYCGDFHAASQRILSVTFAAFSMAVGMYLLFF